MEVGTSFIPIIPDPEQRSDPESIRRVVLCSGKIYYQLAEERAKQQKHDIALIRIEQFYPLPQQQLLACLAPFSKAETVWCQEEPLNMGAWFFIDRRVESILKELGHQSARWRGIGRPDAATPASGLFNLHKKEQDVLIEEVLGSNV
jgi:2-oxoglutarate dehydrogenase E1 component